MIGELAIKFIADATQAKKELAELEKQIERIQKGLKEVRGGGNRGGGGGGGGGGNRPPDPNAPFNDRKAYNDSKARLAALRQSARETEKELARVKRSIATTFDPASEGAQRMMERANRLGRVLTGSQAEAKRLQQELANAFSARTLNPQHIADLQTRLAALNQKIATTQTRIAGLSGRAVPGAAPPIPPPAPPAPIYNLGREHSDAKAKLAAFQTAAKSLETDLGRIKRHIGNTFDPASDSAQRFSLRAERLGRVLQGSQDEARRLRAQLAQAYSSGTLNPAQIQAIQTRLAELNARIVSTQTRIQNLGRASGAGPTPPPIPNPTPVINGATAAYDRLGVVGVAVGNLLAQGMAKLIQLTIDAAKATVTLSAEFEYAMRKIETMIGNAGGQIAGYGKRILELSTIIPRSGVDLADGMYEVLQAGFENAEEAMSIMEVSAKAAVGGFTETKVAADGITTVLNAYRMEADQAARVSDVLFETVKWGKVSFEQMAQGMGMTVTSAALAGLEFEELSASIATMTSLGIKPREAFTAMNNLILSLSSASDEQRAAAKDMGIEWSIAGMRAMGFGAWIQDVNEKTAGNIDLLKEINPNIRAARAAFIVAGNAADVYQDILEKTRTNTGAASEAFDVMKDSTKESWQLFKNQLMKVLIEAGDVVLPSLVGQLDKGSNAFESLTEWVSENREMIQDFTGDVLTTISTVGELIALAAKPILFTVKFVSDTSGFLAGKVSNALEGARQFAENDMETYYRQFRENSRDELEAYGRELQQRKEADEVFVLMNPELRNSPERKDLRNQITALNARLGELRANDPVGEPTAAQKAQQQAKTEAQRQADAAAQAAREEEAKRRTEAARRAREAREEAAKEAEREAKRRENEMRRARERLEEIAAERRQEGATIEEATGRPLNRIEEVTGKVREAVEEVRKLDKDILDTEKQIAEAGGERYAPDEVLAQLQELRQDRARLVAQAQQVAAKPENWHTPEVEKATEALREHNLELEELSLFRIKAWDDAPQQLKDGISRWREMGQEIEEIRGHLKTLEYDRTEAGAALRTEWQGVLERMQAERDQQLQLVRSMEGLGPLTQSMQQLAQDMFGGIKLDAGQVNAAAPAFREYAAAMDELARAQDRLNLAKRTLDPRDDARALLDQARAGDRAKAALLGLENALRTAGLDGDQLQRVLAKVREEMDGLKGVGKLELIGNVAEKFTEIVGAVREIAEAFGDLDEKTEHALDALTEAGQAATAFAKGDYVGMVVHGIKAVISAEKFFTAGPTANEMARINIERNLIQALKDLEKAVLNSMSSNELEEQRRLLAIAIESLANNPETRAGGGWGRGDQTERRDALEKAAKDMGLVARGASEEEALSAMRAWLEKMEEITGRTGLVEAFDNDHLSQTILNTLRQLDPALAREQGEIGGFSNDVAGVMDRVRFNLELIGKSGAAEEIRSVSKALIDSAHDLGDMEGYLGELNGLDLNTAEGRAERDSILARIMAELDRGELDLGDITGDQFQELMKAWAAANGEEGEGSSGSVQQVQTITDIQGNRLISYLSSILKRVTDILNVMLGRPVGLSDVGNATPPATADPDSNSSSPGQVSAGDAGPLDTTPTLPLDIQLLASQSSLLSMEGADRIRELLLSLQGGPVRLPTGVLEAIASRVLTVENGAVQTNVTVKAVVQNLEEAAAVGEKIADLSDRALLQKVREGMKDEALRTGVRGKVTLEVEI